MNGKLMLYLDQFGKPYWAKTTRELCAQLGASKAVKMYRDTPDGTAHVGYVVGQHWCTAFQPVEIKQ